MMVRNKKKFGWRVALLRLAVIAVVTVIAVLVVAVMFSDLLIFQPPRRNMPAAPGMVILPVDHENRITALYHNTPGAKYTLLYSHGNGEDLFDLMRLPEEYAGHGYSMFIYDYQGYGASGGRPGEKQCYRDVETAYRYLTEVLKLKPENIVIYGRSVGSGPSCYLAEKYPAAALVLESPFTSAFRVLTGIWPLPGDKFPNLCRIPNIRMPVMVFHGSDDMIIGIGHGRKLHAAANTPKRMVEVSGAGHNDLVYTAGERYWRELQEFLNAVAVTPEVTKSR